MGAAGSIFPEDEYGPCATRSEKAAALNDLVKDYGKLLKFAEYTARKFRGKVIHADAEDLLHAAILQVLHEDNRRKWYPNRVTFLTFFRGTIRSMAGDWFKRARHTESPDSLLSPIRHNEQTEAAIMIGEIRDTLRARPHAVDIFDLKSQGLTAREIEERLGITKQIYEAAVKWIDRALDRGGFRNE
jgi:RNA polymerase sigma factor (sigma-70 family)